MLDKTHELSGAYVAAKEMDAIVMTAFPEIGHVVDQLRMIRVPVPRPKADEVAIKLAASSMHIDEIYAAQGTSLGRFYGPKDVSEANPHVLGSSVSGTVVAVGDQTSKLSAGDEVIVIPNEMGETGSWATYRCVTERLVMLKPTTLTHVQAAALTMASCVAYGAVEYGRVQPGHRCLVVGASGAVGVLIIQFLKSKGAYVTGVCSGSNAELVISKGANNVIDYTQQDFGDAGTDQFDAVFDALGGRDTEIRALRILKRRGRFVTVVGPQRYIGETKLSWPAMLWAMGYVIWRVGTSLLHGPRYLFGAKMPRKTIHAAMDQVVQHNIRMPIDLEIPFQVDEVIAGIERLTMHRAKGRIVINFRDTGIEAAQPKDAV